MSAEVEFGIKSMSYTGESKRELSEESYATAILFSSIVAGVMASRTAIFPVIVGSVTATEFLAPLTRRATGRRLRDPLRP